MKRSTKEKILKVVKKLLRYKETEIVNPIIKETKYQPHIVSVQFTHFPNNLRWEDEYIKNMLYSEFLLHDLIEFQNEKAEYIARGATKRTATLRVLKK